MAILKSTICCQSDKLKPFTRDKIMKNNKKLWKINEIYVLILIICSASIFDHVKGQQYSYPYPPGWERDPRFYSREGVNYSPPSPGDENYR